MTRLAIAVGAVGVVLAVVYVLVLPRIAAAQVRSILRTLGLNDARFSVHRVSLFYMELEKVEAGPSQWLDIGSVSVTYSPVALLRGRVDQVVIDRARWTINADERGVNWGYQTSEPLASNAVGLHDLSFEQLTIRDSTLVIKWNGAEHEVPVAGVVARAGPHEFDISARAAEAQAAGRLDLVGHFPSVSVSAIHPATEIASMTWLREVIPQLHGVEMAGTCTVDATLRIEDGVVHPLVWLRAEKVSLSKPEWYGSIDEASASIVFNNFSKLATPAHQQIVISKARVGDLPVSDASFFFEMSDPESIKLESASWSMGEFGRFSIEPFEFGLDQSRIDAQVMCRDVGLGPWLGVLTGGRATGEGQLEGMMKLGVTTSMPMRVILGGAQLHSTSPTGWIRTDDVAGLERVINQGLAGASAEARLDEIKRRTVNALKDYQYSAFNVEISPAGGAGLCTITTSGRGRQGRDSQEIGSLTINIHNFRDALNQSLHLKTLLGGGE